MCGIVGVVAREVSEEQVHRALTQLKHRGPDSMGVFIDPGLGVGLGHTRLSIVDLATGQQPMLDMDEELALVCNGEIYDFERMRAGLSQDGYTFRSKSDCEVILALYHKHGIGLFEHLRGEFAFLLLDRRRKTLIACRDRFGVKPLYVARRADRGWLFASEAKAIFAMGPMRPEIDPHGLADENGSLFAGIWNLPTGTACMVDLERGTYQLFSYWRPDLPRRGEEDRTKTLRQWKEETRRELVDAIRLRLRADVPVGVYLSGGVDSALVTAHMRGLMGSPLHAFTVSFVDAPPAFDERRCARLVAETVGVDHHVLEVTTEQLWSSLERCLWHCEQPLPNLAPVAKYLLSEFAQRHVRVVLTGEGADEVFLGYDHFKHELQNAGQGLARRILERLLASARSALSAVVLEFLFVRRRPRASAGPFARTSRDKSQLQDRHPVTALQYRRLNTELRNVILVSYGDRTEMAHSIEGRPPFLDHRLFELAKRMPIDVKISGGVEKHVIREIARGVVPDEVVNGGKWRFSTPVPDMGARGGVAGEIIAKHLSRQAVSRAGIVHYGWVVVMKALRRLPPLRLACDSLLFRICCLQILFSLFEGPASGGSPSERGSATEHGVNAGASS